MTMVVGDSRYKQARRVTLIGALVNAFLSIIKITGGVVFRSHALVADGIHSFADLITDVMVVFASKMGSEAADDNHPYGHQRIETAATFFLSLFLIAVGGAIGWNAIEALFDKQVTVDLMAVAVAFVSIIANEGLFHYTHFVGKSIQSDLIVVNAWHHRSDSLSSLVVAIGLLGSWLGIAHLDAIAAIVVACMIVKMGWDYSWNSVMELIDTGVDEPILAQIVEIIKSVNGVEKMHQLRTRSMGGDIYIDVHLQVASHISVSEGHHIGQNANKALLEKIEQVKDVTVHIDPEDDEIVCPSAHLPCREQLNSLLFKQWYASYPEIEQIIIHYIDGTMRLDIIMHTPVTNEAAFLQAVAQAKQLIPELSSVRILMSSPRLQ